MKKTATITLLVLTVAGTTATEAQKPPPKQEKVNVYRKYDKKKKETIT